MKKFGLVLALLGLILVFGGCNKDTTEPPVDTPVTETEKVVIKPSVISDDVLEWHEVCQYTGDVDGDGIDENVVLRTSAEYDEDGEFLWNDGQDWALYVDDRDEDYVLLKTFLNAGSPYFEVSDYYMEDGAEPRINVITSTGAGFSVKSYLFSQEAEGFVEETIYNTQNITAGGINTRFSSFPSYAKEVE